MSHATTAHALVCGSRNDDYGNPRADFERIASVWSGIIGEKLKMPITPVEVGLLMTGLKLVRHAHKAKDDNLVDAIGYALCIEWLETGVKPSLLAPEEVDRITAHYETLLTRADVRAAEAEAKAEKFRAMVETVACGERLECPTCKRGMPCVCEHRKAQT